MFSNWTDEPETRSSRFDGVPVWVGWAVLPVTLLWLAATAWAVGRALLHAGGEVSDAFWSGSYGGISVRSHILVAVVIAVGPPVLGMAIALGWRRPPKTVLLAAGVVLLGLGLIFVVASADDTPAPEHRVCQEHSGGDNVCPGN